MIIDGGELIEAGILILEIAVLFFVVTVAVQLFQARFGADRLRRWMGGRPIEAALKGIALGFVTPFCTFTAIPMLVGLRQARVPAAGYVAFIVAAPVLDPVLFGALVIIAGVKAAVIYAAVAFVGAVTLAMIAEHADIERRLAPVEELVGSQESSATGTTCSSTRSSSWRGLRQEVPVATRAAANLLSGMTSILLLGVGLSIAIESLVPPEMTERLTSASPTFAIPIAAALGTPLYVSTAVFVPIADGLTAAGVGIGAIVALTIAGAGANLPEFVILSKLASARIVGSFFAYIFVVAITGGFLAQSLIG